MKMENLVVIAKLLNAMSDSKQIVTVNRKGKMYLKKYIKPRNPRTKKQREQRNKLSKAVEAWHNLNDTEKETYNKLANELNEDVSGFNLFVRNYLKSSTSTSAPL